MLIRNSLVSNKLGHVSTDYHSKPQKSSTSIFDEKPIHGRFLQARSDFARQDGPDACVWVAQQQEVSLRS